MAELPNIPPPSRPSSSKAGNEGLKEWIKTHKGAATLIGVVGAGLIVIVLYKMTHKSAPATGTPGAPATSSSSSTLPSSGNTSGLSYGQLTGLAQTIAAYEYQYQQQNGGSTPPGPTPPGPTSPSPTSPSSGFPIPANPQTVGYVNPSSSWGGTISPPGVLAKYNLQGPAPLFADAPGTNSLEWVSPTMLKSGTFPKDAPLETYGTAANLQKYAKEAATMFGGGGTGATSNTNMGNLGNAFGAPVIMQGGSANTGNTLQTG